MSRLGKPDDIARVISFLASNETGWVRSCCVGVTNA
jgi:hypothetical protein